MPSRNLTETEIIRLKIGWWFVAVLHQTEHSMSNALGLWVAVKRTFLPPNHIVRPHGKIWIWGIYAISRAIFRTGAHFSIGRNEKLETEGRSVGAFRRQHRFSATPGQKNRNHEIIDIERTTHYFRPNIALVSFALSVSNFCLFSTAQNQLTQPT